MRGFGLNLISLGLVLAASACIVEVDGDDEGLDLPAALLDGSATLNEAKMASSEQADEAEARSKSVPLAPGFAVFRHLGIALGPTPDPWNGGFKPSDDQAGPTPDPWNPEQSTESSGGGRNGTTTSSNGSKK